MAICNVLKERKNAAIRLEDIARFAPQRHSEAERQRTREECGVAPGERVLLNIGRIAREKNIEQVMRVFPRLLERCPDVRFVIVGEGPMREELGRMIQDEQDGAELTCHFCKKTERFTQQDLLRLLNQAQA